MHVFCVIPLNEIQIAYWKSLKLIPLCFWSSSNHKWRRQQQWHQTKGFTCTLALIVWTFIRFCMQKNQECNNQKFKVLRTQIFSHVISNSKRARAKFKLIGKFQMLRKLKHQKAFLARSLSLFCTFIPFVRKATRNVIKNSRIWDGTQTLGQQISNSKRVRTKFELKGKSVKMLGKFKQ